MPVSQFVPKFSCLPLMWNLDLNVVMLWDMVLMHNIVCVMKTRLHVYKIASSMALYIGNLQLLTMLAVTARSKLWSVFSEISWIFNQCYRHVQFFQTIILWFSRLAWLFKGVEDIEACPIGEQHSIALCSVARVWRVRQTVFNRAIPRNSVAM